MRQIISRSFAAFFVWLILVCYAGCDSNVLSGSRLTPANYDQITPGMNKAQVETILGPPTKTETKQLLVFTGESKWEPRTTYRYEDGQKFATITFKNDQVDGKDSNLGREP
jgi:hypothetical protein